MKDKEIVFYPPVFELDAKIVVHHRGKGTRQYTVNRRNLKRLQELSYYPSRWRIRVGICAVTGQVLAITYSLE